ncbi:MAG: diacylglycerol kinase family protein [Candidatus Woesebacteria bacterium]|nr:MAG: diacylglycerol kinase family protein [Candidatus Woesebacteria bacterium]
MSRNVNLTGSFRFAIEGVKIAIKKEPNFRIHLSILLSVLFISLFLNLTSFEWFSLLITGAFVLTMELFNTAIEAIVDIVSPEFHEKAKIAKDVSAAAVLISAIFAIAIGIAVLLPKIF